MGSYPVYACVEYSKSLSGPPVQGHKAGLLGSVSPRIQTNAVQLTRAVHAHITSHCNVRATVGLAHHSLNDAITHDTVRRRQTNEIPTLHAPPQQCQRLCESASHVDMAQVWLDGIQGQRRLRPSTARTEDKQANNMKLHDRQPMQAPGNWARQDGNKLYYFISLKSEVQQHMTKCAKSSRPTDATKGNQRPPLEFGPA